MSQQKRPSMMPSNIPGMNLPGRRAPMPPPAQPSVPSVEAERLDPADLGFGKKGSSEKELLENAEPILPPPAPPPEQKKAAPPPQKKPVVQQPEVDPLDAMVPERLIDQLAQQYGFDPVELHQVELRFKGKVLAVDFRAPIYDDYLWALSVIEQRVALGQDDEYTKTDVQRGKFYSALIACRCVQKMNGQWLFDLFEMTKVIRELKPDWDGTFNTVPERVSGEMANGLFDLFRKSFHHQFLAQLSDAVDRLDLDGAAAPDKQEDPT